MPDNMHGSQLSVHCNGSWGSAALQVLCIQPWALVFPVLTSAASSASIEVSFPLVEAWVALAAEIVFFHGSFILLISAEHPPKTWHLQDGANDSQPHFFFFTLLVQRGNRVK